MNVVLESEVASWIDTESRRAGITPEAYVAEQLNFRRAHIQQFSFLPDGEAELLAKINEGFPASFWQRYRELIVLRNAEALSDGERLELISFSDAVEQKNAERAPYLIALAQQRGITVPDLVRQLGLKPVSLD